VTKHELLLRLREVADSGIDAPAWVPAWLLLSGLTVRLEGLDCLSPHMDASLVALGERLLNGGDRL
jgi:hypothetical protein